MNKSASPESFSVFWQKVCAELHQAISPDAVERWFRSILVQSINAQHLVLCVENSINQLWIEENYLPQLTAAASRLIGQAVTIKFVNPPENVTPSTCAKKIVTEPAEPRFSVSEAATTAEAKSGLNPRHTLESFVIGPNNDYAGAAAKAVVEAPARTYSPLFIHGSVGLGKTHLMQAIGNALLKKKKNYRVQYITSEQFTNEFISAIQHGELVKFRKRYRQVDALLIDDVQFLAGKERSQEEFFHTFNSLFDGNKQIVVTCDSPPSEIANIEKRLSSRFEWGLTTQIMPPGIETRLAILRHKMYGMDVSVADEILTFIASRVKTNVRRLEGALTRVAAYSALHGRHISIEQAELLMRDLLQYESPNAVTIDLIQRKVAETFDIRLADMTSKRRPAHIALPRMVAMYLSRRLTSCSLAEIGEAFGGRDHGTVLHAHRTIGAKSQIDAKLSQTVDQLVQKLGASTL